MREALLAAMALIVVGAALWHWNGPQETAAYTGGGDGFQSVRRKPNCPPPYWQSRRPVQAVHDDDDVVDQWQRIEPEFPETSTRGHVTTAIRRPD